MIVQLATSQPSAMARKSAILVEDRTRPSWDALPRFTGGESSRLTKRSLACLGVPVQVVLLDGASAEFDAGRVSGGVREAAVASEQRGVQRLGQSDVHGVAGCQVAAQFPDSR